jgi:hypothetical protein
LHPLSEKDKKRSKTDSKNGRFLLVKSEEILRHLTECLQQTSNRQDEYRKLILGLHRQSKSSLRRWN